jgi:hypothetical protein
LQGVHGVRALVELAGLDEDRELNAAPAAGGELVAQHVEAGGDEREQIAGLEQRDLPIAPSGDRPLVAAADRVAVGQQHRQAGLVGVQGDDW